MKRTLLVSFTAFALALFTFAPQADAQQQKRRGAANSSGASNASALAGLPLPASDAAVVVQLRRLLTEAVPRALSSDPARLAAINADVEAFKAKTGIDPRSFDTLAAGALLTTLPSGGVKVDRTVAIARGSFNPGAIVAAGRIASKGSYREEKHGGKNIYVFDLNDQIKVFGLLNMRVSKLAIAELDANTLATGDPEGVRASIDAAAGRAPKASGLAFLSQPADANTLIAFGGKTSPEVMGRMDFGNPELTKSVGAIREFYGAVGMTAAGFDMRTTLRTLDASDAKHLSDTLLALKQFAPVLLERITGERGRVARNAVTNLQVEARANEVQMRLEVPQADVTALVQAF